MGLLGGMSPTVLVAWLNLQFASRHVNFPPFLAVSDDTATTWHMHGRVGPAVGELSFACWVWSAWRFTTLLSASLLPIPHWFQVLPPCAVLYSTISGFMSLLLVNLTFCLKVSGSNKRRNVLFFSKFNVIKREFDTSWEKIKWSKNAASSKRRVAVITVACKHPGRHCCSSFPSIPLGRCSVVNHEI